MRHEEGIVYSLGGETVCAGLFWFSLLIYERYFHFHSYAIFSYPVSVLSSPPLLSGPYSVNGVPLRRVNQRYVIATSTKVDVSGVDVSNIDDSFFKRESVEAEGGAERTATYISAARKAAQTSVDKALAANVEKVDLLKNYLGSRFALSRLSRPHQMKF
jgi:ribosomal protein L14E/L6E/L27E